MNPSFQLVNRFRGYYPVIIDVETAGFNSQTDALLEIAATTVEMDEQGVLSPKTTLHFHINPFEGANLEPAALEFNGINPECPDRGAIDEADAFKAIFKEVRKELKLTGCHRAIMVAHNAAFDNAFVNAAVNRANIKRSPFHPFATFDTASLSGLVLGQTVLAKACKMAGIEFDNKQAHSADYDTERTAELFCFIVNRYLELGGWPLIEQPDVEQETEQNSAQDDDSSPCEN